MFILSEMFQGELRHMYNAFVENIDRIREEIITKIVFNQKFSKLSTK